MNEGARGRAGARRSSFPPLYGGADEDWPKNLKRADGGVREDWRNLIKAALALRI